MANSIVERILIKHRHIIVERDGKRYVGEEYYYPSRKEHGVDYHDITGWTITDAYNFLGY